MTKIISVPSYQDSQQELTQQLGEMLPADKLAVFNHDAMQLGEQYASSLPLKVGDMAPDFSLPNMTGQPVHLKDLLKQGAVVLTFYRGAWCPYCNLQLRTYQQIVPQLVEAGARLVAVSPMTPDRSLDMAKQNQLQFEVLSDVGNKVARQYTTVFTNPQTSIQAMAELGYDFHSFYDDQKAELPVPATYVIGRNGFILLAASEGGDYRQRVEPRTIVDALAG